MPQAKQITVCICTFRRASLLAALLSVANQDLPKEIASHLVVVDNDSEPTAEPLVSSFCANTGTEVEYVHAPGQNISIARNAGLGACRTRWLAFLDDDETVAPDWLRQLTAKSEGYAATFGQCKAIYADATPKWIRFGDYHSHRISPRRGVIDTGYTSNALIDMNFVHAHKLRFDEEYGRTGGEDTKFFFAMVREGARLAYAPEAVAYEEVSAKRATLRWIVARRYRAGQTYAKLYRTYDGHRYLGLVLLSPIKAAACVAIALPLAVLPSRAMWWALRGVFHCGVFAFGAGAKIHQEYAQPI
jgi:succinoglycan biosynthesis protein ExoM